MWEMRESKRKMIEATSGASLSAIGGRSGMTGEEIGRQHRGYTRQVVQIA